MANTNEDYIKTIEGAERRFITGKVEIRKDGEAEFFEGEGIVFNSTTDLRDFTEEVAPEAVDAVWEDDVRGTFNHSADLVLGRNKSGTMTLTKTPTGVKYQIRYNPNDPDHVRVMEKVKRGDVSGSSFAFKIKEDNWSKRDGKPHRKITKLERWFDIGPVTYPAYTDTSVAARSLNAINKEQTPDENWDAIIDYHKLTLR
jgi:HK97 family phage prohead protease